MTTCENAFGGIFATVNVQEVQELKSLIKTTVKSANLWRNCHEIRFDLLSERRQSRLFEKCVCFRSLLLILVLTGLGWQGASRARPYVAIGL